MIIFPINYSTQNATCDYSGHYEIHQSFPSRDGHGAGMKKVELYPHLYPFSKVILIPIFILIGFSKSISIPIPIGISDISGLIRIYRYFTI